jgi:hydroxymethylglutaryl-CoA reductase (NADPH)
MILLGYVLMHITFFLLISRSRQLGSNFWLPTAIVSSSVLALILALPIAMTLRIPMDPVALTEALPFLVCTVGFDKPLRLARAVFTHPHLTTPHGAGGGGLSAQPILLDYALEIAVLVVGAYSGVAGLREVCALAAVLLAVDSMLLCTFLASIFGVMVEVSPVPFCLLLLSRGWLSHPARSTPSPSSSLLCTATYCLSPLDAVGR